MSYESWFSECFMMLITICDNFSLKHTSLTSYNCCLRVTLLNLNQLEWWKTFHKMLLRVSRHWSVLLGPEIYCRWRTCFQDYFKIHKNSEWTREWSEVQTIENKEYWKQEITVITLVSTPYPFLNLINVGFAQY